MLPFIQRWVLMTHEDNPDIPRGFPGIHREYTLTERCFALGRIELDSRVEFALILNFVKTNESTSIQDNVMGATNIKHSLPGLCG